MREAMLFPVARGYETAKNSTVASIEQESPTRNAMAASVHNLFRAG